MEFDIYTLVENDEIECKEAAERLPNDLWETYSAFANTNGGTLFLGIKERSGRFFITGVNDEENIIKDLWDNLNNPKKASANILNNNSIERITIEGLKVIKINVPKADRKARPVYIGENPFNESKHSGTFRRNYSGDYKCSKEEIKRMLADQLDHDEQLIFDYIMKNKFITNSLVRRELKLSKTTASRLFNKLISKEKIMRIGSGSQIKYVISDNS